MFWGEHKWIYESSLSVLDCEATAEFERIYTSFLCPLKTKEK